MIVLVVERRRSPFKNGPWEELEAVSLARPGVAPANWCEAYVVSNQWEQMRIVPYKRQVEP